MEKTPITLILNGNTYRLSANDTQAINQIPKAERQQLISLLDAIKREEQLSEAAVQQSLNKVKVTTQTASNITKPVNISAAPTAKPERLGSGDVDAIMSRLILEEKQHQKPGLTKGTIYKWMAGIVVVIILLALIF